jgi:chromosome segregation ATPase
MEMNVRDVIELIGVIVLPLGGFVLTLIINGIRSAIKRLEATDMALAERIEESQREARQWQAEVPEKYARRDELQKAFELVNSSLIRLDEKLDRLMHRDPPQ